MVASRERKPVDTAFALGGLGGNNYHGLGFLHAAQERGLVPDMISCTSGQIDLVWKYLLARAGRLADRYRVQDLAGLADVYREVVEIRPRWPFPELYRDIPDLIWASIRHATDMDSLRRSPLGYAMDTTINNLPARVLAPSVKDGTLEELRDDFNTAEIGIAFNSYNPAESVESVYLNPRAQEILHRSVPKKSSFRKTESHVTEYRPITVEGLQSALWLYEYGFDSQRSIDGAYFRMVMLGELSRAKTIFVARPIRCHWDGPLPVTHGEKEDLKTEVFFNAAYLGERFRIELINRQLKDRALTQAYAKREGYHHVDIYEVEPRTAQPFAEYFAEDLDMFKDACEVAGEVFDKYVGHHRRRRTRRPAAAARRKTARTPK